MPITTAENYPPSEGDASSLPPPAQTVLIFYASIGATGKMWCPDCLAVEDLIKETFKSSDTWHGVIIYVGDRPTWKSPQNVFRKSWRLAAIPTLVRLDAEGKELSRLVESEITPNRLREFLAVPTPPSSS